MSVYQSSKGQGDGAVRAAINMLEGKDLTDGTDYTVSAENDRVIYIPFELITADNTGDYR